MEIVIATHSPHKLRELKAILKPLAQEIDWLSLHDYPHYQPPPESGQTFEENARLKAVDAAHALNKWVLADDSGLVVPILGGAPGIYSKRYAGTDKENRKKLLAALEGKDELERNAHFECVLALASPQGEVHLFKGRAEGFILPQERGGNGFGYDPLFIKHGYSKTFAEMDEATKNRISHRGRATEPLILFLRQLLTSLTT